MIIIYRFKLCIIDIRFFIPNKVGVFLIFVTFCDCTILQLFLIILNWQSCFPAYHNIYLVTLFSILMEHLIYLIVVHFSCIVKILLAILLNLFLIMVFKLNLLLFRIRYVFINFKFLVVKVQLFLIILKKLCTLLMDMIVLSTLCIHKLLI